VLPRMQATSVARHTMRAILCSRVSIRPRRYLRHTSRNWSISSMAKCSQASFGLAVDCANVLSLTVCCIGDFNQCRWKNSLAPYLP
jgi:hypothetical protein